MTRTKGKLADALHAGDQKREQSLPVPESAVPSPTVAVSPSPKIPSRAGKQLIGGYFDPAVAKMLKHIALDEDTTLQELIREGINHVLAARGKPQIA
jgi:antitoxin-like ribbon-helix-helix protein